MVLVTKPDPSLFDRDMLETRLDADATIQREWPAVRAALLDIAASIDRLQRAGADRSGTWSRIHAVLAEIERSADGDADRAERVLRMLSREYDPSWRDRFAAGERSADPTEQLASQQNG